MHAAQRNSAAVEKNADFRHRIGQSAAADEDGGRIDAAFGAMVAKAAVKRRKGFLGGFWFEDKVGARPPVRSCRDDGDRPEAFDAGADTDGAEATLQRAVLEVGLEDRPGIEVDDAPDPRFKRGGAEPAARRVAVGNGEICRHSARWRGLELFTPVETDLAPRRDEEFLYDDDRHGGSDWR